MKEYRKKCKNCGCEFKSFAKSTAFCSKSCNLNFLKKTKPQKCEYCQTIFSAWSKQRFCSLECAHASQIREHFFTCKNCGKEYSAKSVDRKTFCSRECAFLHKSKQAKKRGKEKIVPTKEHRNRCCTCGKSFKTKFSFKKYCSDDCSRLAVLSRKYPKTRHLCAECGKGFDGRKSAIYCSAACSKRAVRRERRHRMRSGNCFNKKAITIRLLGIRDGWRCGICGKKIRKDAVGFPDGPSIDHIIPLAAGGEHNWSNTQIAHIGCNTRKGASRQSFQLFLNIGELYVQT